MTVDEDERDTDGAHGHAEVPAATQVERVGQAGKRARRALDHQALGSNTPGSVESPAVGYIADVVARLASP